MIQKRWFNYLTQVESHEEGSTFLFFRASGENCVKETSQLLRNRADFRKQSLVFSSLFQVEIVFW